MKQSSDLVRAFVAAFPDHVASRLHELGIDAPAGFQQAVAEGAEWLEQELTTLLAQDPARQRRSPLELFQEALEAPTEALRRAGVLEPARDPVAVHALPGDIYDLAPATSRVLGEAAWRSHVAWGIAKAEAVAGVVPAGPSPAAAPETVAPLVALVGVDLMDRTRIAPAVEAAGFAFTTWRNPAAIAEGLEGTSPAVVLVDLNHAAADEAIRSCTAAGIRTIAFGPHVDDIGLARATALGALDAVPRSRFFPKLDQYLRALA